MPRNGLGDISSMAMSGGSDSSKAQQNGVAASRGADVILSSIHQVSQYGPVGDIYAYSIGNQTCNIGDVNLQWTNFGTPGLAMNAYRLHEGRLMQIGIGFVKHACCAATFGSCGGLSCNGVGGSQLGVGCLDIYSAGWNAGQSRLGPRTVINPYCGQFNSFDTSTGNSIFKRLQIHADDLDQTTYGDALYFVEGVYVGSDDAAAGNWFNNATYRRVTVNPTTFSMSVTADEFPTTPAILAWRQHGNGPIQPDPDVQIQIVDMPGEGRFYVGWKSSDNGDGTWRYEYAVYNLNSHQSAGAFSVNIGEGANISNVGFHAPFYHSGENQDNTLWVHEISNNSVTWRTAESYEENPNANAIRWGTMYNFWFDSDHPPVSSRGEVDSFIPSGGDCDGPPQSSQGVISGFVYDQSSGNPIVNATISSGTHSTSSSLAGAYSLSGLTPDTYAVSANADGYFPTSQTVNVSGGATTTANFFLISEESGGDPGSSPVVVLVSANYSSPSTRTYYLNGVPLSETFTATISWNGHEPHAVEFITPTGTVQGTGGGNTWSAQFEMGSDFSNQGELQVRAIADGGSVVSAPYTANMLVVDPPTVMPAVLVTHDASSSVLRYTAAPITALFDEGVEGGVIPDSIPLFGGEEFKLTVDYKMEGALLGSGTSTFQLGTIGTEVPKIAGVELDASVSGALEWLYSESERKWNGNGSFQLTAGGSADVPPHPAPFVILGVPCYWQGNIALGVSTMLAIDDWDI